MDDEMLRLECLKMALEGGLSGSEARADAQRQFNWIKGRSTTESGDKPPVKARIVGRDGGEEFQDYIKD
jgi:hypothetical protein